MLIRMLLWVSAWQEPIRPSSVIELNPVVDCPCRIQDALEAVARNVLLLQRQPELLPDPWTVFRDV